MVEPQEGAELLNEIKFQEIADQVEMYNELIQNMKKKKQDAKLIHN